MGAGGDFEIVDNAGPPARLVKINSDLHSNGRQASEA